MTTPETARCACSHKIEQHQQIVSAKSNARGPCQVKGCRCAGPL